MLQEDACTLERKLSPARKLLLYVSVGAAATVCLFYFFAAWIALIG